MLISDKDLPIPEFARMTAEIINDGINRRALTAEDLVLVNNIVIGCTKLVCKLESEWYNRNFKLRKRPINHLVLLSLFEHLASSVDEEFRPSDIRSEFSNIQEIDGSPVSRAIKQGIALNTLKRTEKKSIRGRPVSNDLVAAKKSGPQFVYSKTEYRKTLEKLVSREFPRAIIFAQLLGSQVLERYLRFAIYAAMINLKTGDSDDLVKLMKTNSARTEQVLTEFKTMFEQEKKDLSQIKPKEIMSIASERAREFVDERD